MCQYYFQMNHEFDLMNINAYKILQGISQHSILKCSILISRIISISFTFLRKRYHCLLASTSLIMQKTQFFLYLSWISSLTVNGNTNPSSSNLISTSGERRKEKFLVWYPHKHYLPVFIPLICFDSFHIALINWTEGCKVMTTIRQWWEF